MWLVSADRGWFEYHPWPEPNIQEPSSAPESTPKERQKCSRQRLLNLILIFHFKSCFRFRKHEIESDFHDPEHQQVWPLWMMFILLEEKKAQLMSKSLRQYVHNNADKILRIQNVGKTELIWTPTQGLPQTTEPFFQRGQWGVMNRKNTGFRATRPEY